MIRSKRFTLTAHWSFNALMPRFDRPVHNLLSLQDDCMPCARGNAGSWVELRLYVVVVLLLLFSVVKQDLHL